MNNPSQLIARLIDARQKFETFVRNKQAFNYKYADLDSILNATEPHLIQFGLNVHTTSTIKEIAGKPWVMMTGILSHRDGGELVSEIPMPLEKVTSAKIPAQDMGSIITYGRRYVYCALLNLTPSDEDIDGAPGEQETKRPAPIAQVPKAKPVPAKIESPRERLIKGIKEFVDKHGKDAVMEALDISDSTVLRSWDEQKLQAGIDHLNLVFLHGEPF